MSENILIRHLKKYFPTKRGLLHAVDDVNFSIKKGTAMGLVGESGCGKSTVGRLILRLTEATDGKSSFMTTISENTTVKKCVTHGEGSRLFSRIPTLL